MITNKKIARLALFAAVFAMVLVLGAEAFGAEYKNIFAAAKNGTAQDVIRMIKAGAKVNVKDKNGGTPLMSAAFSNPSVDVIAVLLKAGANVNAQNVNGVTPLMLAAANNTPRSN